jgi:hypothetical protein
VATDGDGGGYHKHLANLQWEFAVIDDKQAGFRAEDLGFRV